MSAATPGIMSLTMLLSKKNKAYKNDREYVLALAREMKKEYEFVVSQGYILQLDAPDLAMERVIHFGDKPLKTFSSGSSRHIEAINIACDRISARKARLHVCWGTGTGPASARRAGRNAVADLLKAKVGGCRSTRESAP